MNFIANTLKVSIMLNCCLQADVYEDFYEDKNLFGFSDYPRDSNFFDPVNKEVKNVFFSCNRW